MNENGYDPRGQFPEMPEVAAVATRCPTLAEAAPR